MSSAMVTSWDLDNGGYTIPVLQKYIADYKRLRSFYYADYYPLTSGKNITSDSIWLSYQMNRPKEGDGIVVAFRRPACPIEKINVKLRGLEIGASYELFFEDENIRLNKSGKELMENLELLLKEKSKSLLISYKKIK
jgi:alpha-galactosidase